MELSDIQFCNGTCRHMVSNGEKKTVIERLGAKTGYKHIYYDHDLITPLTKSNASTLSTGRLVTVHTAGMPCLLYLSYYKNKPYCFLIDQRIRAGYKYPKILVLDWSFANYAYNDTLLTGKVGQNPKTQQWVLMLYDAPYINDRIANTMNIIERHVNIHKLLDHFSPNSEALGAIQIARLFNNKQISDYDNYIKLCPLPITGVLFMHPQNIDESLVILRTMKRSKLLQQIIEQIRSTNHNDILEFVCECERSPKSPNIGKVFLLWMNSRTLLQEISIEHLSLPSDIDNFRILIRYDPSSEQFVVREIASQRSLTRWRGSLSAHIPPVWYNAEKLEVPANG